MNHDNYYEIYLEELSSIIPCSEKETKELLEQLYSGSEAAAERLIEGHLYLIPELLGDFENKGVPVADLVQEANMGLTITVTEQLEKRCSPEAFKALLTDRTRLAMEEAVNMATLEEQSSEEILARVNVLKKVSQIMAKDLGREATLPELAEFMKMSEEEVKAIMKLTLDAMSVE